jgi:signal transduction histidine kinase
MMRKVGAVALAPRGAALWRQVVAADEVGRRQRAMLLDALRTGDARAITIAFERWDLARDKAAMLLADFGVWNLRALDRRAAELEQVRARSFGVLAAVLTASVLILVVIGTWLEREVVRPLRSITARAGRIAEERVAIPIDGTERRDEIGALARALTRMTADLVRATAVLEEAVRARDEFLSVASHELKTPLTSLKLQLQQAARKEATPPAWVAVARRQADRLERLVSQLLDVTRIRAGRFSIAPRENADLSALVAAALERLGPDLARAGNRLAAEIQPGVVGRVDEDKIDQVLVNLISNAIRHAPGAEVSVTLREADGRAKLEVRDRGPGIPPEAQARLFAPFERGGAAAGTGGLGLGLYIVKEIARAHAGAIRMESAPGAGTAVVVELPLR